MSRDILGPEEASALMDFAQVFEGGRLVNYIALALFSGLRPDIDGELGKLARNPTEPPFDWKFNIIRIRAAFSKTNSSREIDIQPVLASFLSSYPLEKYPLQLSR